MTGFLKFLLSGKWQSNTMVVAVILLAVTATAIYLTAFVQGREVSFWPPKIGANPISAISTISSDGQCDSDIATIRHPRRGETVPQAFDASGTLTAVSKNQTLWLISTDRLGSSERYWPQDPVNIDDIAHSWSGHVGGIGKAGETRTFGIFLVGKNGEKLLRYWKSAARYYVGGGVGRKYLPLAELTDDIILCHEIDVKVTPNGGS